MGVSRVFQGCFKSVSRVFQEYFKSVSRVFQGCFKGVSGVITENQIVGVVYHKVPFQQKDDAFSG